MSFARRLLAWWDVHGRKDLPWQRDRTPYRVWISEVMLQQTRATTVVPYFERFVRRFPGVDALARAELDEVLHLWSGLGYYARARNLHRAAGIIVREHGGVLPDAAAALAALPGVGRSTAAAIAAQGFGRRAAILDANVKRVLARRHRVAGPVSSTATLAKLWRLAELHTPAERVADYTQAIMDLGATVCRRSRPRCAECPVGDDCEAAAAGDPERFPERAPRRERRLERSRFFVVVDPDGACLVEQRPPRGVWGGLWSPPGARRRRFGAGLSRPGRHRGGTRRRRAGRRRLPARLHPLRPGTWSRSTCVSRPGPWRSANAPAAGWTRATIGWASRRSPPGWST